MGKHLSKIAAPVFSIACASKAEVHNHAQPQLEASPSTQTNIKHSLTHTSHVTHPHPHLHLHSHKQNRMRMLHAWTHAKQKHARTFNLLINKCHTLLLAVQTVKLKTEAASQTTSSQTVENESAAGGGSMWCVERL